MSLARRLLTLFVLALFTLPLYAALTGDLEGTVYDPTGAVLANVKVVVTNTATGTQRVLTTNQYGQFSALQLALGTYKVTAERQGFNTEVATAVIRSAEKTRVDLNLKVGQETETVTVEATTPALDVATAQMSDSISSKAALELPNQGRNALQFATLSPGIVPVTKDNPFLGTGSYNSNGSRGRANNITIDNTTSTDISTTGGSGIGTFSLDAIQEFKLITNNFDAEYGRNSGSQLQIITKGGTNQYHGDVYYYHQNAVFNARPFFDTTGNPTPLILNNWGFVAGGPIIKDETFVFGHYEGLKIRGAGGSSVATVLTPAQAAAITDPTSKALFAAVGAPTSATGVLSSSAPNKDDEDSWSLRVDQKLRAKKDTLTVRYGENPVTTARPGLTFIESNLPNFGANVTNLARQATVNYASLISPNIVNQFRFSFGRSKPIFEPLTTLSQPFAPMLDISGFDNLGVDRLIPQGRVQNTFQYGDTLSWTKGKHSFKFGTDILRYQAPSFFDANFRGIAVFSNLASFQAGVPLAWVQNFGSSNRHNFSWDNFWFVEDDYRITDTFTANIGFRLESSGGVSEENNLLTNLDLASTQPLGKLGTGPLGSLSLGGTAFDRTYNPAPRLGFAWNPRRGKLVVRGGYGIAYDFLYLNPITNLRFAAPFVPSITLLGGNISGVNSFANLAGGTAQAQTQAIGSVGQLSATQADFGALSPVDPGLPNPRTQQYDVGLEYQAMKDLVLKATYVGTKSDHLQDSLQINPVQPGLIPAAATSLADEQARLAQFQAIFGAESGNASGSRLNDRIDHRFDSVTQVQGNATSNYNALELQALKQFRYGLQFNASYTYAHSIDDVSDALGVLVNDSANVQDPRSLALNRANSQFDVRHRFIMSWVYDIPFAHHLTGVANRFLDGWSASSEIEVRSGLPASVFAGTRQGINDLLLVGNSVVRADGTFAGFNPVPINPLTGVGPLSNVCARGVGDIPGTKTQCANTSGFQLFQPFLGNAGDTPRNGLRLAGLSNVDFAMQKSTRITEGTSFEFRWEVFNLFNHPNFSGFVNTLTSRNFGTYTRTATNERQMQGSVKFIF